MSQRNNKKHRTTSSVRDRFVERYGDRALRAMDVITGKMTRSRARITVGSLAAYKANVTRGAYEPFVRVNQSGEIRGSLSAATKNV